MGFRYQVVLLYSVYSPWQIRVRASENGELLKEGSWLMCLHHYTVGRPPIQGTGKRIHLVKILHLGLYMLQHLT